MTTVSHFEAPARPELEAEGAGAVWVSEILFFAGALFLLQITFFYNTFRPVWAWGTRGRIRNESDDSSTKIKSARRQYKKGAASKKVQRGG